MPLRRRVLLIFLGLGVLPILVVGWMAQRRTLTAIEELVSSQAQERADRLAEEIDRLYRPRRSELLYFAENNETLGLLRDPSGGPETGGGSGPSAPDPRVHLQEAWERLGGSFQGMQFITSGGQTAFFLGQPVFPEPDRFGRVPETAGVVLVEEVTDPTTLAKVGEIRATLDPGVIFPPISETAGFGRLGEVMVVDRVEDLIVTHRLREAVRRPFTSYLQALGSSSELITWPEPGAVIRLSGGDSLSIGAFAEVPRSPWVVASLASVDEFSTGIVRTGRTTLAFVALIAGLALFVGMAATKRALGSLDVLTVAAGKISEGDFSPGLPEPGSDEVGTLARAFRAMVREIEGMVRRIEENRQLAAVGEFASQVAHEIRNPLTAIRVNLQALRRDLVDSPLAADHGRPLDLTIGEVDRLDRVTRGVLTLAQSPMQDPKPVDLHLEIRTAIATLQPDLEGSGVSAETFFEAGEDAVLGNASALRGAIINLIRNAAEAMPDGGTVKLRSELVSGPRPGSGSGSRSGSAPGSKVLRLHIVDEGPGISESVRDRLFDPFVTTKDEGSGLGLAVALRAVEAHGGELQVLEGSEAAGAHFTMDLPLLSLFKMEHQPPRVPGSQPSPNPGHRTSVEGEEA